MTGVTRRHYCPDTNSDDAIFGKFNVYTLPGHSELLCVTCTTESSPARTTRTPRP